MLLVYIWDIRILFVLIQSANVFTLLDCEVILSYWDLYELFCQIAMTVGYLKTHYSCINQSLTLCLVSHYP